MNSVEERPLTVRNKKGIRDQFNDLTQQYSSSGSRAEAAQVLYAIYHEGLEDFRNEQLHPDEYALPHPSKHDFKGDGYESHQVILKYISGAIRDGLITPQEMPKA